jgi:hypothetical protein
MKRLENRWTANFCLPSFWRTISEKFTDERSCLACFLAYHSAEVLSGVKPGNLVSISNCVHPCGKNLLTLWRRHGDALIADSGLVAKVLAVRRDSHLVYLYCRKSLDSLLAEHRMQNFLKKAGYGELSDSDAALAELERRLRQGGFPHEIGLFLGYPLKDVAGFMGWTKLPVSGQDTWKIYGNPRKSLELAACHRDCRCRMAERLRRSAEPSRCLRKQCAPVVSGAWRQTS